MTEWIVNLSIDSHFFYCWRALARQLPILCNSKNKAKSVGCKIKDMRSRLCFLISGHFGVLVNARENIDRFLIGLERGLPYQAPHIRPQHTIGDPDLPHQTPTYHIRPRSYRSGLTVFLSGLTYFGCLVDWLSKPNQKIFRKALFLILKLLPKLAKNHEISVYYVTHRHNFEIQLVLVSRKRMLLSWKVANRYKFGTSYAWWG